MASSANFSYQKLRYEAWFQDDGENAKESLTIKSRKWQGLRKLSLKKRFKIKIPSLRRALRRRLKLLSSGRNIYTKVLKRLKESQAHFGDLFAGNYMFMQVNPTPFKCIQKSHQKTLNNRVNGLPRGCTY